MEDVPPSYQSAIDREAWNVIAPWIPSGDLCSACLVSRKWHSIFAPFLWGDPASHFGIENDAVYVALTRFKRTLRKARPSVRDLTHTLHLPSALSEIYGGPNPTWLRDVLEYLPNLQSLIVSKLPFFDHLSLLALRNTPSSRRLSQGGEEEQIPRYGLKLLLAAQEPNTTSISIASALPCFPNLVYLDLSYVTPARDAAVLSALSNLYDLQVLKLRGIGLRDSEAEVLANTIGIRVRLLDLRENLLTDMAVRSLLQTSFLPADARTNGAWRHSRLIEDWPVGIAPGPDFFSLATLRSEELDHELLKQLTNPLTGRLAFEDIPHRGLTHLYISDNHLSVEGLASLLRSERLHVLDGGSVDNVKIIARTRSLSSPTGYTDEVSFPGAEKLIPVLAKEASKNLTYLRVDHAVVTKKYDVSNEIPMPRKSVAEVQGTLPSDAELPSEGRPIFEAPAPAHYAVEMPAEREPIFELDATPAEPRYELIGDIMQFAISPPIGDKPQESESLAQIATSPIRGEGPYAPEVVVNGHVTPDSDDEDVILDASGTGTTLKSRIGPTTASKPVTSEPPSISPSPTQPVFSSTIQPAPSATPSPSVHRLARIDLLLRKRPQPLSFPAADPTTLVIAQPLSNLHPAALPNLRTLILTGLPTSVPQSSPLLPALKSFISACADEAALALLRAQTNYSLPPGRARLAAELDHARSLFALKVIVLEMLPPGQSTKGKLDGQARGWHHNRQRVSMSKSSTGDHDSENMWSAAENDFSFFGEEGEEHDECGIYDHDPEKYFPTARIDDKILLTPQEARQNVGRTPSPHGSVGSLDLGMTPTVLRSPRDLPLGRNRRSSGEGERERGLSLRMRMRGTATNANGPAEVPASPTSNPMQFQQQSQQQEIPQEPMVDLIAELAAWRKERKKAYEDAVMRLRLSRGVRRSGTFGRGIDSSSSVADGMGLDERDMPFVEGHWKGEIRVVKNAVPKGRTGVVDMYGNYFEKGYLYP
jgi:hypothetical protein